LSNSDIIAVPSGLRVLADPALVERALGNFIGNAIRHAHASRILIGARHHDSCVRIWVIDDGVGIPVRDQEVIFDHYVQGSNHGDEIRGGFGLGLATVVHLAKLMNGTAGLDKRWKNGSAFWLELPAATA
jgi:signal transduction histidine kinase